MNQDTPKSPEKDNEINGEAGASRVEEAATEAAEGESAPPVEVVKDSAEEIAAMKEQVLRAMAEAENTRRRMQKEMEEAKKYAVSKFAKEMLTVSDNFRRALETVDVDVVEDEALKNVLKGIAATERQLEDALGRFGVKRIESPLDKPFDPHLHQVMMEQEDPSKPAGMVVQVLQDGYTINDRLLREAMVVVAKGGPAVTKVDTEA